MEQQATLGNIFLKELKNVIHIQVEITSHLSFFEFFCLLQKETATTSSTLQTIQQGVGFNQNLNLQPSGGTITLSGATTCLNNLNVSGTFTCNTLNRQC